MLVQKQYVLNKKGSWLERFGTHWPPQWSDVIDQAYIKDINHFQLFSTIWNYMKMRLALGKPFSEWSYLKIGSSRSRFFLYDVLTLLCKVYYFGKFMGDVHCETMTRIWLVQHKISKYFSMPKKRLVDYYSERFLFQGLNHIRSLTTLFCYLPTNKSIASCQKLFYGITNTRLSLPQLFSHLLIWMIRVQNYRCCYSQIGLK